MPSFFFVPAGSLIPADLNAQEGGFRLINGSQHDQTASLPDWDRAGVSFANPDRPLWGAIDPNQPIRKQALVAWRSLLAEMDRCHGIGLPFHGIMLGGYAPIVSGLYHLAANMRHAVFAAVMAPSKLVSGEKKTFVPSGVRLLPPPAVLRDPMDLSSPPSSSATKRKGLRYDRMVYTSARPLEVERNPKTPDVPCRKEVIATVEGATLLSTKPALPPLPGSDLEAYTQAVKDIVELADAEGCPILLDGPPAETLLRVAGLAHVKGIPLYFLRTEILEAGKVGRVTGVEELPKF